MASAGASPDPDQNADDESLSIRHLAHELNSLLDGSLRYVGLAARMLQSAESGRATSQEIADRLRTAQDAMWQMAELLERVMAGERSPRALGGAGRTLGDEVRRVVGLLQPLAASHGVEIDMRIAPEAARLPSGALGAIVGNAVRNAIQACARQGGAAHRVELTADVEDGLVEIRVSDTGPGIAGAYGPGPGPGAEAVSNPAGHGLGIAICRKVVQGVGGRLVLETPRWGWGTCLRAEIPLERVA